MTDTTPTPNAATTGARRGGYLPTLPDGWAYNITIVNTDADDGTIQIIPEGDGHGQPTGKALVYVTSSAGRKTLTRASLAEGIRAAVDASKVLDRLAKSEAEVRAARQAAMDSIGGGDDDGDGVPNTEEGDEPRIVDEVDAGDLAKAAPETDDEREAANGNGIEDVK